MNTGGTGEGRSMEVKAAKIETTASVGGGVQDARAENQTQYAVEQLKAADVWAQIQDIDDMSRNVASGSEDHGSLRERVSGRARREEIEKFSTCLRNGTCEAYLTTEGDKKVALTIVRVEGGKSTVEYSIALVPESSQKELTKETMHGIKELFIAKHGAKYRDLHVAGGLTMSKYLKKLAGEPEFKYFLKFDKAEEQEGHLDTAA